MSTAARVSFTVHGASVSGGIAIGKAHSVSAALPEVAHYVVPDELIEAEVQRFDSALVSVAADLEKVRAQIPRHAPTEIGLFLDTHRMILADRLLAEVPRERIRQEHCSAEWALQQQMVFLVGQFDQIEDSYLRERKHDVEQVVGRIIKVLLGHPSAVPVDAQESRMILVAYDLSPADVLQFKQHQFAAFITDLGGVTSHTAILARNLHIPAIVAMHGISNLVESNDVLIVDGSQGVVIVNPTESVLAEYQLKKEQWDLEQQKLKRLKSNKAVTLDGVAVALHANIETPEDVEGVHSTGATGVGLYRTEFLFMNRQDWPGETEQFEAYQQVVLEMRGMPVTIRTLDIGADKQVDTIAPRLCANPALGLRAIRLCLAEPQVFHIQLRAILRASHYGVVKILFPMLCTLSELHQTLHLLDRAKQSLRDDGIPFDEGVVVGGMIEIPAAALKARAFARHLDFLSVGTNDLIQYTLAIDRTDDAVAHLYTPLHPAVLQLVAMTIRAAKQENIPISVCGEMAGDPALTRLLLGMGLREFSTHSAQVLTVKQQVLQATVSQLSKGVARILACSELDQVTHWLQKLNKIG